MEKGKLVIGYERNAIQDYIGTDNAKIKFLQSYPKSAVFYEKETIFYATGIYQLAEGPPIIILPWFLKNNKDLVKKAPESKFLDVLKNIEFVYHKSIDLISIEPESNAKDLVIYSYLNKIQYLIKNLKDINYLEYQTNKTNTIRGKWNIEKDILTGSRPTQFTCSFTSVTKNMLELIFIKSFCEHFKFKTKSKKNIYLIQEILTNLKETDLIMLSNRLIFETRRKSIKSDFNGYGFQEILNFSEQLFGLKTDSISKAGFEYTIKMDDFFEDLISKFLKKSNLNFTTQKREELLGGAIWKANDKELFLNDKTAKTEQFSIPDFIVQQNDQVTICECKYKPLKIPLINDDDKSPFLISFSRSDRNQIISFILSMKPSQEIRNKKLVFSVFFPCSTVEEFKISQLVFNSSKLSIDPIVRSLSQNRREFESDESLKINFVGLNIEWIIKSLMQQESREALKVLDSLNPKSKKHDNVINSYSSSNIIDFVKKRTLLTAFAIKKSHSNSNSVIGQVKLAKILYLAESHLNIDLKGSYERMPMGPLDHAMIYNKKFGVNVIGENNSYYKLLKGKKFSKYVTCPNIDFAVDLAEKTFSEKITNINWLIDLIIPLDSEQAEIVSTLYACWNDLLSDGKNCTDIEIVNEFLNNWHSDKIKYSSKVERLHNALKWMRSNNLVPNGQFRKTKSILNSNVSGF